MLVNFNLLTLFSFPNFHTSLVVLPQDFKQFGMHVVETSKDEEEKEFEWVLRED